MAKKIFLSPSNQVGNQYAYGGTTEAIQCGRIAEAAKDALERCGFDVRINHLDPMSTKVAESNSWGADLHIPIHTNACNGVVSGTRIFYYSAGSNSYKASKAIYDVLAPLTPGTSESMSAYPSLYEMRNTTATSVYIEVDFHDVPDVAKWIIYHTTEIGEAICRGVCHYYGVSYVEPGTKPYETTSQLYRVRKAWSDAKSQIGAYENLANAKAACKDGYKVFDKNGNVVYDPAAVAAATETEKEYPQFRDSTKASGVKYKVKANGGLNLRAGAGVTNPKTGKENEIITTLDNGSTVWWYGFYSTVGGVDWYWVKTPDGITGFVSSKYLTA